VINAIKFSIEEIEASDQYFDHTGTGTVINAIKFSIEEIEASDQYFDHTGGGPNHLCPLSGAWLNAAPD